jgi:hypothetical protein
MKKVKSMVVMVLIAASIGLGAISASAAVNAPIISEPVSSECFAAEILSNVGITPFASPIVERVQYNISRTVCSVRVTLTNRYSGTIRAVVQQRNSNGTWSDFVTIANDSFGATFEVFRTTSTNLPSGTYRISLRVTADGHVFTENSNPVTIS